MPVSHLGLTVSHIPSATSFYLAALQPLGYRFIGHQGNSIGLGVISADFFLTQSPTGYVLTVSDPCHDLIAGTRARILPNHIAFLAEDRLKVRECYASALNSGGRPSGSPNYRNQDCSCFNAAVEDLDGNTIEFIFRQPHGEGGCCDEATQQLGQRSIQGEEDVEDTAQDENESIARTVPSQSSMRSRAKSSMQTALDLASMTSRSVKSEVPSQSTSRANSEQAHSTFPSRTMVGTALGAAAGAALMYAISRAERVNAKEEADHLASLNLNMRSRSETRRTAFENVKVPPSPTLKTPSVARSVAPTPPSVRETRKSHRNFSTTESAFSTRRPPLHATQAMRMLEQTGHTEDEDVQQALGRYNSLRAMPTRSKTQDEYAYTPASRTDRSEYHEYREDPRYSTILVENSEPLQYLLEGPKSALSIRSATHRDQPIRSASHSSHQRHVSKEDARLHRNDSGVSVHSSARSHHHRDRGSDTIAKSSISTVQPTRRDSASYEALPRSSRASSKAPSLLIETAAYYPAAISLPPSVASSRRPSKSDRSPATIPPIHHSEQSWEQFTGGEESDGLSDIKTVVPDDSISCVDLSKHRRRRTSQQVGDSSVRESHHHHPHHRKHTSSRHGSRRSETSESTVKPVNRASAKDERSGKRSLFGL